MNTDQQVVKLPQGLSWKTARKSKLAPKKAEALTVINIDVIQPTIKDYTTTENIELLQLGQRYYESLEDFRTRRRRVRRYVRGDQWKDTIRNPDNSAEYITEESYIRSQGRVPLKQNVLASIKNNLVGRYRDGQMKPIVIARDKDKDQQTEMLSNALRAAHDLNYCKELDARNFEEYIISGLPIQKIGYKYWKTRNTNDAYVQNINANRIFFNTDIADVRLFDLRMIGELIDLSMDELLSVFAKNAADEAIIRRWYAGYGNDIRADQGTMGLSSYETDNIAFYMANENNKCRIIEMWYLRSEWRTYVHDYLSGEYYITTDTLDEVEMQNTMRVQEAVANGVEPEDVPLMVGERKYESFWYVKFLTPWGHCLYEGETPYKHEEHPYVMLAWPLIDGDVYGIFDEFVDNQRYINRLVNMLDTIIGASAKGVLLVPEESIPEDMDIDDFADEWSRFNGVIKIKAKANQPLPQQINSSAVNVGISDMLNLQLKLLQEISGVNYAIQGQRASGNTPASLYAQEAANASINSKDVMDSFTSFIQKRDFKLLKVIHQFYKESRMLAIAGDYYAEAAKEYNPESVRDLDFDVNVTQTIDTPSLRQVTDDFLLRMLEGGLIDVESYLEHSTMPFAQQLLTTVRQKREDMQQAGVPGQGQLPEEMNQEPQIRPEVQNVINRMLQKPKQ